MIHIADATAMEIRRAGMERESALISFSRRALLRCRKEAPDILRGHLFHGASSAFQSLGLNTPRLQHAWCYLGWAITLLVGCGNLAIVGAVWAGFLT